MNPDIDDQPPVICDVCLGDSDSIRMTKIKNGAQCKICTLPFTMYHFKPHHRDANLTKTLICLRCSKQRNTCQCCMLDMVWHIPVQLRDQMLSMIQKDPSIITEEAKNDMMKRFLALKDTKLGGARITSNPQEINGIMNKLQNILHNQDSADGTTRNLSPVTHVSKEKIEKFKNVDISRLLRKLPLNSSFGDASNSKSFFLYNIDPSIPEWKISSSISRLINLSDWQDHTTTSLIVNHKAKCGGIRFKSDELGRKFVEAVQKTHSLMTTTKNLQRGVLRVEHFQVFVIPWVSGFSTSSFGSTTSENIKLSLSLDKLIKIETNATGHVESTNVPQSAATGKSNDGKVTKKKKKSNKKRITHLEL